MFYIWEIPRQIEQIETVTIFFFFPFKYVIDGHKK